MEYESIISFYATWLPLGGLFVSISNIIAHESISHRKMITVVATTFVLKSSSWKPPRSFSSCLTHAFSLFNYIFTQISDEMLEMFEIVQYGLWIWFYGSKIF